MIFSIKPIKRTETSFDRSAPRDGMISDQVQWGERPQREHDSEYVTSPMTVNWFVTSVKYADAKRSWLWVKGHGLEKIIFLFSQMSFRFEKNESVQICYLKFIHEINGLVSERCEIWNLKF